MRKVLSIDGGGLYGAGVAAFLNKLNYNEFDLYAGTSVGSIIAAALAHGISPKELNDLFRGDLPKQIFKKPGFPQSINPMRAAKYTNEGAIKAFKKVFGENTLIKDLKKDVCIVAWNYNKKKPKVYTKLANNNYTVWEAVLSSISAPTYFPIAKIDGEQLGDGGLTANDPVFAAVAAVVDKFKIHENDIRILSLSTTGAPPEKTISVSNISSWLPVISDAITLGNMGYADYCATRLLTNYKRLIPVGLPGKAMDNFDLIPGAIKAWEEVDTAPVLEFLK